MKVLVLCQRKTGDPHNSKDYQTVKEDIVPKINILVDALLQHKPHTIEYLSSLEGDHKEGTVDIKGFLQADSTLTFETKTLSTRDFVDENEGTYALILLNTCPFMFMDFDLIYQLLAADGLMVFSAFPRAISSKINFNIDHLNKLFKLDNTNTQPGIFIYNKKLQRGSSKTKTKTKKKRTRRRRARTKRFY
jgi:hypothetical protein